MIQEISQALEQLLQEVLYPAVLISPDYVSLCVPRHEEQDYMVGIYLFDMEEDGTQRVAYSRVENGKRRFPDKNMTLSYVIFINEETRFGGYNKAMEAQLLEKLIQIFHDHASLKVQETEVMLQFVNMTLENKIRFWTSLNKPLQPSLFIRISPVPIASLKQELVDEVRHVDIHANQKEEAWDKS